MPFVENTTISMQVRGSGGSRRMFKIDSRSAPKKAAFGMRLLKKTLAEAACETLLIDVRKFGDFKKAVLEKLENQPQKIQTRIHVKEKDVSKQATEQPTLTQNPN